MKIAKIALIACVAASFGFGLNPAECLHCTGGDVKKLENGECIEPCGAKASNPPTKQDFELPESKREYPQNSPAKTTSDQMLEELHIR